MNCRQLDEHNRNVSDRLPQFRRELAQVRSNVSLEDMQKTFSKRLCKECVGDYTMKCISSTLDELRWSVTRNGHSDCRVRP